MKNFMLLDFPFIPIRFLFVGDRFLECAMIARGLCGWSDIIEVLLDCDACFFVVGCRCCVTFVLEMLKHFLKRRKKGRKRKTHWQLTIIDFSLVCFNQPVVNCLALPSCVNSRATKRAQFFQHLTNNTLTAERRWRWRTNFIDIQLWFFFFFFEALLSWVRDMHQ